MLVGTKKDEFMAIQSADARREHVGTAMTVAEYNAALDIYAEGKLRERMDLIQEELLEIPGGRFDAAVAVDRSQQHQFL